MKRSFKIINRLYFDESTTKKTIKKPYVQDCKLYFIGGKIKQNGGSLGFLATQLLPIGIEIAKKSLLVKERKTEVKEEVK